MKVEIMMEQNRVTKNTVRYDYPGEAKEVAVSAVYIQKTHLPPYPHPDAIKVTVETV